MTTPEPRAVDDTFPDAKHQSARIAIPSAGVGSLTALKDTVEVASLKTIFESVTGILTLVKVRVLAPFSFLLSLIGDAVRMRYRTILSWN